MNCCGNHLPIRSVPASPRNGFDILPDQPCIFCAEKHICGAWDKATECGYAFPNRQAIIGALESAEQHLFKKWFPLFAKVRAIRHLVQLRCEYKIDWKPLLAEIDALAAAEAAKLNEDGHVTQ